MPNDGLHNVDSKIYTNSFSFIGIVPFYLLPAHRINKFDFFNSIISIAYPNFIEPNHLPQKSLQNRINFARLFSPWKRRFHRSHLWGKTIATDANVMILTILIGL